MVVQITTAFLPVPHVQSALCPGVSRLDLLCSRYGSQAGFRVSTMQRQGSSPQPPYLACRGRQQLG
jgi:hypothetical protein